MRRGTVTRIAAFAAVLAIIAPLAPARALPRASDTPPATPAPSVLDPLDLSAAPAATPAGVAGRIGALADDLDTTSVVVVDPVSGEVLFGQRPGASLTPASTLKLTTAAAALTVLGPDHRLATSVVRDGTTYYLVGGGDPTLVSRRGGNPLAGGSASLATLADAVIDTLTANTKVRVVYDASAFTGPRLGPGWKSTYPAAGVAAPVSALVVDGGHTRAGSLSRVVDPARQAATVFAGMLRSAGLRVGSVTAGTAPADAEEVAHVESPPVSEIVERMLTESDNNDAEALAHLVGGASGDGASFAGGAQATVTALADLGVSATGLTIVDGSGLSTRNRLPVRLLTDVLRLVVGGTVPALASIASGLPVAGLTGTLADRFDTAATRPGRGVVHAKTGTLTSVAGLAGTVVDRDGRLLVFAMIANAVKSLARIRDSLDLIASRLAGCGCG